MKANAWKCDPKWLALGWARQGICCRIRTISQVFRFLGACLHKKCREATQNCSTPETFSPGGPLGVHCFQRANFNPSINSSLPPQNTERPTSQCLALSLVATFWTERCWWQEKDVVTPEVAIRKPRVKFHFGFSRKLPHEDVLVCNQHWSSLPASQRWVSYLPLSTLKVVLTHFKLRHGGSE